ncbi:MAG: hypothetical protein A2W90_04520 [Bacteroidetes bacterium GWF2_42_66]|nr:MAG: hypothetical protein A2W92_23825 [Bacteroidetes bacterium GWA2_42_15]OFY00734.1 MAG: hypothetical protein A2W89_20740 [Bacteroidetes bacterium GWE2_42_39]OFY40759.1 MAG: hypothetical protein A2W90_04520 [Bacteroidetes bacterium GWF2_42_66]HBL75770.1 hypothetical protein [Prolixibacteraceae bacterium]HCR89590.1 hypothetical protein [Prolixibacteraceae bacterium]
MEKIKILSEKRHIIKMLTASFALILLFTQCEIQKDYEYEYNNPGGKLTVNAWEYIQQTDSLSLLEAAITATSLQSLYTGTTDKTFIAPRNSAFRTYMKTNKYTSISAIPVATLQSVIKYHIVKARVIFSDPEMLANNPIAYETESGQVMYLSRNTSYQGLINYGTKKSWTIITSNLEPTNGVLHVTADVVYLSL